MTLPKGWYRVASDPEGTQRYWDGDQFVSRPVSTGKSRHGFVVPGTNAKWQSAGIVSRLVAAFVDYAGTAVILVGIGQATGIGIPGPHAAEWAAERNLLLALAGWIIINHVVLVGFFGVTMGKILLGLRVVDLRTRQDPPGIVRAFVRQALLIPSIVLSPPLVILGRREGFHDLVARTAVVYA